MSHMSKIGAFERALIAGDRGDGFDWRDPAAPAVFCCDSCDAVRDTERAYCRDCGEVTGSYVGDGNRFPMLTRIWRDADYSDKLKAEREGHRAECHAAFDAIRDKGLRRAGLL